MVRKYFVRELDLGNRSRCFWRTWRSARRNKVLVPQLKHCTDC